MKGNSLQSLLKQTPQTPSYTPSSFIKGFTPVVIIESTCQSPLVSSRRKIANMIPPEAKAALEKSLADISLYRNPIPADILTTISNKSSSRSTTLKIFRSRFQDRKNLQIQTTSGLDDKKVLTKDQIHRDDSLKTVQCFLERTIKERGRKQKDRPNGSMFINDLWSEDYEKRIIKATKLDNELKEENFYFRRPLGEKLEGLKNLYEKKIAENDVEQALSNLRKNKKRLTYKSPDSLLANKTNESAASPTNRLLNPSASEQQFSEKRESLNKMFKINYANKSRTPMVKSRLYKMKSDVGEIKTEESFLDRRPKVRIDRIETDVSLIGKDDLSSSINFKGSFSPTSKTTASPLSPKARLVLNKRAWAKNQRKIEVIVKKDVSPRFEKHSFSALTKMSTSPIRRQGSSFFVLKAAEAAKGDALGDTHEAVLNLIEKCDNELEDKDEVENLFKDLMKSKIGNSKRAVPKEVEDQRKKEKAIEDFKFMLQK